MQGRSELNAQRHDLRLVVFEQRGTQLNACFEPGAGIDSTLESAEENGAAIGVGSICLVGPQIDLPGAERFSPTDGYCQQVGIAERDIGRWSRPLIIPRQRRLRIRKGRATHDLEVGRHYDKPLGDPVVIGDPFECRPFPDGSALTIVDVEKSELGAAGAARRHGRRDAAVEAAAYQHDRCHLSFHEVDNIASGLTLVRGSVDLHNKPKVVVTMAFTQFDRVPNHYAGSIIQRIKDYRQEHGRRSLVPTRLGVGELEILIPRHFGFCFGVERAIHMAFSALDEHPDKPIHLVSEIIHNPLVNNDLRDRGIDFIYDAEGQRRIAAEEIDQEDVVLIPAFGTTLEIENSLQQSGIDTESTDYRERYDTTCPFVSKVWDRGAELGREGYTIIIHGKFRHEETQATHSHTKQHTKSLVVLDKEEAIRVGAFITGDLTEELFASEFADKWSQEFDPQRDLQRVAVVNQTTMLAEETKEVASIIRDAMCRRYGDENLEHHFADTNDTLCYATNWNQNATKGLLDAKPDVAVIVGGYNSSNTSHLVEICSQVMPSYLIGDSDELVSHQRIRHFDMHSKQLTVTDNWLVEELPTTIAVTSGASCPDVLMNGVVERIAGFFGFGDDDLAAALEDLSLYEPAAV